MILSIYGILTEVQIISYLQISENEADSMEGNMQNSNLAAALNVKKQVSLTWPRGNKTFFMLNSTEHEISTAHKS